MSRSPGNPDGHTCCVPQCHGPQCQRIRQIAKQLDLEISTHEFLVNGSESKDTIGIGATSPQFDVKLLPSEGLEQAASRLHHINLSLQELLVHMKTTQGQKPHTASVLEILGLPTKQQGAQVLPPGRVLNNHQNPSSHGHASLPPPSPVSLNTPIPSNTPLKNNQHSPIQTTPSAQSAHLQDLQHQLSVKTLAMQTLQHEYDALIQKLERQRTKCATLEKKFEVSDAEICGLSNDKDRLELHIEVLEKQIEKLHVDRDEARKASSASAAQYLLIMEMAGRLQGKAVSNGGGASSTLGTAAEGGKSWEKERERLLKRIEELEATVVVGGGAFMRYSEPGAIEEKSQHSVMSELQEEVQKLRERNVMLEKGLVAAKQAALTLAAHGNNVGLVLNKALEP
jgi:hypothetical protein